VSSGGTTPAISLAASYGDTQNPYASKTTNFFLAAPNGSSGAPTFRAIVAADIPTLNQNTTGTAGGINNASTAYYNATGGHEFTGDIIFENDVDMQGGATVGNDPIVTLANAQTLTNKRINPRVSTTTTTATLSPVIADFDQYNLTALASGLTINAPTGTPLDGNKLIFRILDNGTSQTLSWNATYTVIGVTLPTTTTSNKMTYVGCIYNAANTRWDVIAVTTQA
jgi:hypothetical protein